jgi:hypothetical protein
MVIKEKKVVMFEEGDYVMYPDGIGTVVDTDEQLDPVRGTYVGQYLSVNPKRSSSGNPSKGIVEDLDSRDVVLITEEEFEGE